MLYLKIACPGFPTLAHCRPRPWTGLKADQAMKQIPLGDETDSLGR